MRWSYGTIISRQAAEIELLEHEMADAIATLKKVDEAPKSSALAERARLTLHFYGDARTPYEMKAANIWRWYYLQELWEFTDQGGSGMQPGNGTLFICFDQPVRIGMLRVLADKPLPPHEVKDFDNRFAIIAFLSAPPECDLDIEVTQ
jgi:hypothetical protein